MPSCIVDYKILIRLLRVEMEARWLEGSSGCRGCVRLDSAREPHLAAELRANAQTVQV